MIAMDNQVPAGMEIQCRQCVNVPCSDGEVLKLDGNVIVKKVYFKSKLWVIVSIDKSEGNGGVSLGKIV